jgi:nitrate reductase gamma subunit
MAWTDILRFLRGPLFAAALLVFVGGMALRLIHALFMGWSRDRVPSRGHKLTGVVKSYLKGIFVLPFIPWVERTFGKNALTYIAGGLFHLSLFAVIFFGTPHMLVWKSLFGFGWPTLPLPIADWLAAVGIMALLILLINRLTHPVLKLITRAPDWVNWALVFLPFATGYMMTHHMFFRYDVLFSLHMVMVDALLIWIPFSRIPHLMFYFFSRTFQGAQAGKRAVNP